MSHGVVILSHNRPHLLEKSAQAVMRHTGLDVDVVILDNCGTRKNQTMATDLVYSYRHRRLRVMRHVANSDPGLALDWLLAQNEDWTFVAKIDDDVFVTRDDWLPRLWKIYNLFPSGSVGFVSGLIPNNCFGWVMVIKRLGLESEYKERWGHILIKAYGYDSIWGHPRIAQWLWLKMLEPGAVSRLETSAPSPIICQGWYNIGCCAFRPQHLWYKMGRAFGPDDERRINTFCEEAGLLRVIDPVNVMHHFAYCSQYEFLMDTLWLRVKEMDF